MRHLIIGGSSQVGEALIKILSKKQEEIISTFHKTSLWGIDNPNGFIKDIPPGKLHTLDITKRIDIERLVADINPDIIYLPAAQTNVDYCEDNPEETAQVNINGVVNVVNAVNNIKLKFDRRRQPLIVFYSTDYIFDGSDGPYNESHIPSPINVYGRQKLEAEHYLATNSKQYLIIRTTGVFGPEKISKNFVNRLIKRLNHNEIIEVSDEEMGTPTYTLDLAEATTRLTHNVRSSLISDVVNIAGREKISRYQFALEVAKAFNYDPKSIIPVKSSNVQRSAKRPLICGLKIDKAESIIGRKLMSYQEGLIELRKLYM